MERYEDPNTLMERESAGVRVAIAYLPMMAMATLTVEVEDRQMACSVPLDRVMDAYHHPMLYLSPAAVDVLLPSPATRALAEATA